MFLFFHHGFAPVLALFVMPYPLMRVIAWFSNCSFFFLFALHCGVEAVFIVCACVVLTVAKPVSSILICPHFCLNLHTTLLLIYLVFPLSSVPLGKGGLPTLLVPKQLSGFFLTIFLSGLPSFQPSVPVFSLAGTFLPFYIIIFGLPLCWSSLCIFFF